MRILVTGQEGQVARSLAALANEELSVTTLGRPDLDITEAESIARAIELVRPDIVVNPAAYTAVDKAESEAQAAFAVNRDGARNVAAAAAAAGLPVIHVSTDYVFAGNKAAPYIETDATGPTGIYGSSKLEGEQAIAAANEAHVILRTAWVYSPYGHNFLKTMLRLAADRDVLRVVADQHGTPTYAPDIAEGIVAAARKVLSAPESEDWRGIFHMVAQGETNWASFAEEIFAQSARRGGPSARVEPITTADYPTPARRPAHSRLDTTKFRATFGHALPDWENGVARCLTKLTTG
ncbi:dTDP-4-dehydrorhamnose reductase [Mesorhizobium sp. M7D.F.Ca.US.005.01.1.1]|uniref:dTDP-4-dehydrorhamnose reductase n=1 Tax=Mesorhizobium sp. M7D.F.Ca.US.005.01.1.1 TaxID=2493678 RepID=UPI000F75CEF7|nr:dTDP-4-dehydrorhamnose reductase [Mesorhizobium sp. M7D.F.Ca.US.005.01.1.1]AZO42338.1 dTDP-4-dehydrorhamnose reductase [Mesorhizobium sp. M7D.F.Ca.US.005.01.1.1]